MTATPTTSGRSATGARTAPSTTTFDDDDLDDDTVVSSDDEDDLDDDDAPVVQGTVYNSSAADYGPPTPAHRSAPPTPTRS